MKKNFPPLFEKKFSQLLGSDFQKLKEALFANYQKAIRINTLKISVKKLTKRLEKRGWVLKPVPWTKEGFFVETKEKLGKTLEHLLGYYFVQDATAQIPVLVLDPKPSEKILDLCAAPGGKTIQVAQMMKNRGLIFANEPKRKRLLVLKGNLQRCGVVNAILTNLDGRIFWKIGLKFKKILLDVPCSGSGTFISNFEVLNFWHENFLKKLSHLQKNLLASAFRCLEKGGEIVYSTCSLDPEENEEVIDWAIKNFPLKVQKIEVEGLKFHQGFLEYQGKKFSKEIKHCLRIFPFDYFTEGFFITKLKYEA